MDAVLLQKRFAKRVREAMEVEQISQSELARRMDVTPAMIWQYLNGVRSPGLDVVEKFAKALSVEEPSLLLGAEQILLANA